MNPKAPRFFSGALLALTGAAALAACSPAADLDDTSDTATSEILAGTTATSSTMRREIGRWLGCTATLIAPQWVLTAGHCNNYMEHAKIGAGSASQFFTSTNGTTWATALPGAVGVARAMYLGATADTGVNDISLLRLSAPVSASVATPTSIAATLPTSGRVTSWGAGCTDRTTLAGGGPMRFRESLFGDATSFLCPGDSGGPRVVGARSANGRVYAVHSAMWGGDDVLADATARRAEIEGVIAEWASFPLTDIEDLNWCRASGDVLRWADVDGDGDPDAICANATTGARHVAQNHRRLVRPWQSSAVAWCSSGAGRRLLTGDFNGDGRTDTLCHTPGFSLEVDYAGASPAGRYAASDWTVNTTFCGHATGRLHAGDFDGDGRSDLLCHDTGTGQMWIDFTDGTTLVGRADWDPNLSSRWCSGANQRLYVGEFNGDGATDLVCHRTDTGALSIQFSDHNRTPFVGGTDDSIPGGGAGWPGGACTYNSDCRSAGQNCEAGVCRTRFCVASGTGGAVRIADVTGDGRSDILCEGAGTRTWVVRSFAGSPDGDPRNAINDDPAFYIVADARFRPRTAHAASRPDNP
ncbi:MAG: FG-GAP-like repeat-containing protein [Polyangiales bacterium]